MATKQSALSRMAANIRAEYERKLIAMQISYENRLRQAFGFCEQWYADQAQIAAAEAFHLDPDGLKRFVEILDANRSDFIDLWNADTPDCDYTMVKIDERLKEVCGPYFIPHEERYGMSLEELRKWTGS